MFPSITPDNSKYQKATFYPLFLTQKIRWIKSRGGGGGEDGGVKRSGGKKS